MRQIRFNQRQNQRGVAMTQKIIVDDLKVWSNTGIDKAIFYCEVDECNDVIKLRQENEQLLEARNHFMAINLKYYNALEEISSKLDRALDADETDAEESFNLLYEIQDKIEDVLNDSDS